MTDRNDPDQSTPAEPTVDVPPFEMPTAGRPPTPAGVNPDDEPTVVSGPGEQTRPLGLPSAANDRSDDKPGGKDRSGAKPAANDRSDDKPGGKGGSDDKPGGKGRSDEKKWPVLRGADEDKTRLLRAPAPKNEDETPPAPEVEVEGGATQVLRAPSRAKDATAAPPPPPPQHLGGLSKAGGYDNFGGESTGQPADDEPTVERDRPDEADERLRAAAEEWFTDRERPGERAERPTVSDADETVSSTDRLNSVRGVDGPGAGGSGDTPVQNLAADDAAASGAESASPDPAKPAQRKLTSAGALIWVLLALLGYTLVVQLRSNNDDQGLATARQEDLVSILSDLESRDSRLQSEIASLQDSQRQLTSGVSSRQAALAEAEKRADELGLLAGTLPGRGPGLKIVIDKVKASAILNAVEELRGAGGEVMELAGADGTAVRIVASSYFVDAEGGGIDADGTRLAGPWTLWVIGSPQTMQTALQIPGGVVASVNGAGGSVTMEAQTMVEVTAVRKPTNLQYARPAS
jgi:uncharacterized protein YlxW (UPF0749 family)